MASVATKVRCSRSAAAAPAATASADDPGGDPGPGVVLAAWNPDASWEDEQLVRIYAIHGALEARAVVYVTHDLDSAASFCTRAIELDGGAT